MPDDPVARGWPTSEIVPGRRLSYAGELALLHQTYHEACEEESTGVVRRLLESIGARPTVYVGSGGALAVARFAADAHQARTGGLAVATTPLGLLGGAYPRDTAAVILSSRAGHPDVALALDAARRALLDPVVLLTHRDPADLETLSRLTTQIVRLPWAQNHEGFLATRSVLAMATAIAGASDSALPAQLPSLQGPPQATIVRGQTLILHGPRGGTPAIDLETRLSELGLSAAQVADYRNFAHGRHYGFSRNLEATLVVAFADPIDISLADATLALLPSRAAVVRLATDLPWPSSALDLLVSSMRLVGSLTTNAPDPARPNVPQFGRRLYHLSARRRLSLPSGGPVDRKLDLLGRRSAPELRSSYESALDGWLTHLAEQRVGGLVLDYDGTVCSTNGRFGLPDPTVQTALLRLLEAGLVVGVASGRGRSLVRDLRAWVPETHWDRVELGLYNGTICGSLRREFTLAGEPTKEIADFVARLEGHPLGRHMATTVRPTQVSITLDTLDPAAAIGIVGDLLARSPALPLRAVRSAHSIDVIGAQASKLAVEDIVAGRTDLAVLAIGDQGQPGGNDYDLLAASPWSLSVDRCSSDPSRCWNLLPYGEAGPLGLARYLAALHMTKRGARFRWPHAR